MKLLRDANLSPGLVSRLASLYPGSAHVCDHPNIVSDDLEIWNYAAAHGFVFVSKDADFLELSLLQGPPPKVIFLRLGNCPTDAVVVALEQNQRGALEFGLDAESGVLIIDR